MWTALVITSSIILTTHVMDMHAIKSGSTTAFLPVQRSSDSAFLPPKTQLYWLQQHSCLQSQEQGI